MEISREIPEPPSEKRKRAAEERRIQHETFINEARQAYRPNENASVTSDPYKTLFVGRVAYETSEKTLRRVFEEWGPVKNVTIVLDREGRSRGYAFVEYEHERDLKDAYKHADGIKVDGRSLLVDVERARTVPGWYPRRLGGGKGPGRVAAMPGTRKRKRTSEPSRPRTRPEYRRRSPARGGYQKYQRGGRDSRRSSFDY